MQNCVLKHTSEIAELTEKAATLIKENEDLIRASDAALDVNHSLKVFISSDFLLYPTLISNIHFVFDKV
jgi:hypothetical protein